jgi:hypothetical protein
VAQSRVPFVKAARKSCRRTEKSSCIKHRHGICAASAGQSLLPPKGMSTPRESAFVCYSHKDKRWLDRIQVHLKPLVREGLLDLWDDTKIGDGAIWREEIELALSRARVAILIVSADFLASDFIANTELPRLLDKAANGGATILSVIVGPCLYTQHRELSKYQAINPPEKPLQKMSKSDAEATLVKLAKAVDRVIKNPR